MGRPRKPTAELELSGALKKRPERKRELKNGERYVNPTPTQPAGLGSAGQPFLRREVASIDPAASWRVR